MAMFLSWRATCRETYIQSVRFLKDNIRHALKIFLPCDRAFLALLTECGAVIGGEFALSVVLLNDGFEPGRIDVFVNNSQFERFMGKLKRGTEVAAHVAFKGSTVMPAAYGHSRDVHRREVFCTSRGRLLHVYETSGVSACSAIARSWCTGLMNFVTEFTVGCAYPRLTLMKQAIISDLRIPSLCDEEYVTMARLIEAGFDLVHDPTQLPTYFQYGDPNPPPGIFPCLANLFICPDLGRHFGDAGSLVLFLNPLGGDVANARALGVMPFGVMAAWRLWCTHACNGGCADRRGVVPRGMISMPCIFVGGSVFYPTLHRALFRDGERTGRRAARRMSV